MSINQHIFLTDLSTFSKPLTPAFSYFLGLLVTDGHLQCSRRKASHYTVHLFTSYEEEKEIIFSLIHTLFKYRARSYYDLSGFNKRPNIKIQINSKILVHYLHEQFNIPFGNKSHSIRIPHIFFETTLENVGAFIRGVIDGDGCIKKSDISISSGSLLFMQDLQKILDSLRIKSGKIRKEKTVYLLTISNKAGIAAIYSSCYKNAEYVYPRKLHKIEKIIFKNKIPAHNSIPP